MVNKLLLILSLMLLPLVLGWEVAKAADPQDAGTFKVVLLDGSQMNGAVSLVINLDTPYGQIKIPSSSLVSARFDVQQKWADIQLNDAQLKLRYNPTSSDVRATTTVGPFTFALSNVIEVAKGTVAAASGSSPIAAMSPNTAASQASAPPPTAYAQQQPPVTYQNPYAYQSPYQYQYVQPAPYYNYDYAPYYGYGGYYPYYYGYGWPYYYGLGFGWGGFYGGYGRGFGRGFGGFHGGGFGGFHGGGGGHGGGGHGR